MSEGNVLASTWSLAVMRAPDADASVPAPRRYRFQSRPSTPNARRRMTKSGGAEVVVSGVPSVERPLRCAVLHDAFQFVMQDWSSQGPVALHSAMPLPAFLGAPFVNDFDKNKTMRQVLETQPALARWCFTNGYLMSAAVDVCAKLHHSLTVLVPLTKTQKDVPTVRCSHDWDGKLRTLGLVLDTVRRNEPADLGSISSDAFQKWYSVALWGVLRTVNMLCDRLMVNEVTRGQADVMGELLKNMLLEDVRMRGRETGSDFVFNMGHVLPMMLDELWHYLHDIEYVMIAHGLLFDSPDVQGVPFEVYLAAHLNVGVSDDGQVPHSREATFRPPEATVPTIPVPIHIQNRERRRQEQEQKAKNAGAQNEPGQGKRSRRNRQRQNNNRNPRANAPAPVTQQYGLWDPAQRDWLQSVLRRNSRYALPLAWQEMREARDHREVVRTQFQRAVRLAGGLSAETRQVHELPFLLPEMRAGVHALGAITDGDDGPSDRWSEMDDDEGVENMPPPPALPGGGAPSGAPPPEARNVPRRRAPRSYRHAVTGGGDDGADGAESGGGAAEAESSPPETKKEPPKVYSAAEQEERRLEKRRRRNRLRRENKKKKEEEEKTWQQVQKNKRHNKQPPAGRIDPARVPVRIPTGPAKRHLPPQRAPPAAVQPVVVRPAHQPQAPRAHPPPQPAGGGEGGPRRNAWEKPPSIPGHERRRPEPPQGQPPAPAATAPGQAPQRRNEEKWQQVPKQQRGKKDGGQQQPRRHEPVQPQRQQPQRQQPQPQRQQPQPQRQQPRHHPAHNRWAPDAPAPPGNAWHRGPPKPKAAAGPPRPPSPPPEPKPGEPGYRKTDENGVTTVVGMTKKSFADALRTRKPVQNWAQNADAQQTTAAQVKNDALRLEEAAWTGWKVPRSQIPTFESVTEGFPALGAEVARKERTNKPGGAGAPGAAKKTPQRKNERKREKRAAQNIIHIVPPSVAKKYKRDWVQHEVTELKRVVNKWTQGPDYLKMLPASGAITEDVLGMCLLTLSQLQMWLDASLRVMPYWKFEKRSTPYMTALNPFTRYWYGDQDMEKFDQPTVYMEHKHRVTVVDVVLYLRDSVENVGKLRAELMDHKSISVVFLAAVLRSIGADPDAYKLWRSRKKFDGMTEKLFHLKLVHSDLESLLLFTVSCLTRVAVQDSLQYLLFSGHVMMSEARVAHEVMQYQILMGDFEGKLHVFEKWIETAWGRSMDDTRKTFVLEHSVTEELFMRIDLDRLYFTLSENFTPASPDAAWRNNASNEILELTRRRETALTETQQCVAGPEGVIIDGFVWHDLPATLTNDEMLEMEKETDKYFKKLYLEQTGKQEYEDQGGEAEDQGGEPDTAREPEPSAEEEAAVVPYEPSEE